MIVPNLRLPLLTMLIGAASGGWMAWQWQANSFNRQLAEQASAYQRERATFSTAVIAWQKTQQAKRQDLEARLQANDEMHYKELHDAQHAQARLRDRLATADVRLSVLLDASTTHGCPMPADSATISVVHGTTRAELAPAHAQRIVGITDDGDQGLIALKACQAYVKDVTAAP
ncbi:lysis system i-spanin subunit Rz [Pseudomonas syringae]|uniref:Lysis system i-spanin subunit Rz n=2 Tax=Pseudomonas syringae TaxID=317 RepID=A0AAU8LFW1_PSESX